jgi:hypothetical protein
MFKHDANSEVIRKLATMSLHALHGRGTTFPSAKMTLPYKCSTYVEPSAHDPTENVDSPTEAAKTPPAVEAARLEAEAKRKGKRKAEESAAAKLRRLSNPKSRAETKRDREAGKKWPQEEEWTRGTVRSC